MPSSGFSDECKHRKNWDFPPLLPIIFIPKHHVFSALMLIASLCSPGQGCACSRHTWAITKGPTLPARQHQDPRKLTSSHSLKYQPFLVAYLFSFLLHLQLTSFGTFLLSVLQYLVVFWGQFYCHSKGLQVSAGKSQRCKRTRSKLRLGHKSLF